MPVGEREGLTALLTGHAHHAFGGGCCLSVALTEV
jgi:hypothetical protein